MKRMTALMVALGLCCALPVLADHHEGDGEGMPPEGMMPPEPPPPLDSDLAEWFVGEWEGHSEGPMGKAKQWRSFKLGLGGQYLLIHAKSMHGDGEGEGGEGMMYEGMGSMTKGPEGHWVGFWIDNMRGMYKGRGRREEDRLHMAWEGPMGVAHRMMRKVDENTYEAVSKMVSPDGHEMVEKLRLQRVE